MLPRQFIVAISPISTGKETNCPSSIHQTLILWMRVWLRETSISGPWGSLLLGKEHHHNSVQLFGKG